MKNLKLQELWLCESYLYKHYVTSMAKQIGWCAIIFSALSCEDTSLIKCAWKIFNWNRWFHGWVCWSLTETLQKGCLHLFNENSDNIWTSFLLGYLQQSYKAFRPEVAVESWQTPRHLSDATFWSSILGLVYLEPSRSYALGQCHASSGAGGWKWLKWGADLSKSWRFCKLCSFYSRRGSTSPFPATTSGTLAWTSLQATNSRGDAEMASDKTSGEEDVWLLGGFWWSRWLPTPARTVQLEDSSCVHVIFGLKASSF